MTYSVSTYKRWINSQQELRTLKRVELWAVICGLTDELEQLERHSFKEPDRKPRATRDCVTEVKYLLNKIEDHLCTMSQPERLSLGFNC